MLETAKLVRQKDPQGYLVFISPCLAKKAEAVRLADSGSPLINAVLTFEELNILWETKNIDPKAYPQTVSPESLGGQELSWGRGPFCLIAAPKGKKNLQEANASSKS